MINVISVRFRSTSKVYYFDPGEHEINLGDGVIVETTRGMEYGEVVNPTHEVHEDEVVLPLKQIIRVATDEDKNMLGQNASRQEYAFNICEEKIKQHNLDMKLVDVEYSFNGSKITFFFTADGRVDFRELVKDLARIFKTRIDLRQIGVRDEARMIGGIGGCGRVICCKQFLTDFQPVSIKMAKEQSLSLSPTKISGICGRLMCCLKYEQDNYEQLRKKMPRIGREVITPDGSGFVMSNQIIAEKVKVRITLPDGTLDVRDYSITEIKTDASHDHERSDRNKKPAKEAATATSSDHDCCGKCGKNCIEAPADASHEEGHSNQDGGINPIDDAKNQTESISPKNEPASSKRRYPRRKSSRPQPDNRQH